MQIIYEVPGTFRIMLMRDYLPYLGASKPKTRKTAIIFHYRHPHIAAVESTEWPESLLAVMLALKPADALAVHAHLDADYRMSAPMLDALLGAPRDLLTTALATDAVPTCA